MAAEFALPAIPAKHSQFLDYVRSHPEKPIVDLVQPYNEFDAVLRKIYAQQPSKLAVADDFVNVVPVFDDSGSADIRVRARDISSESNEVKERYLLTLKDEDRRPNGSPAVVTSFKEYQQNFNIFCESSLSDMDWSNVVAAGSAVATSLLPVPKEHANSKRGLRHFYHEQFAPASDVDLFLYGLTEEQAIEKIKQIETKIKDSILAETTTVRTKNAITIASQYPTRHVQIVLRIYKSIAEILTGFDVDCSCVAYDGNQVYMAPRGIGAYITQVNQIDLSRRSPSYENRLSKYSHRGFEVFWPHLDRSRIDPTVYERSFTRTMGLARLLVLEKLPKVADREEYLIKRRTERGRPTPNPYFRGAGKLRGNIKNDWDDEVPDWLEGDEVSDYHTFTVPYGEKFHARKIEKLLYTKDLLLNAEWNKPKDRTVNLHRHPAFFGRFSDVIHDCCGYCPEATTAEDNEVAEVEDKIYVKGDITFLKDNPGRQEIGSFNPITETDWTDMAYVGNTEGLCQAIVDHDAEEVKEWLSQDGSDPNRRDYTGRTPLHLATMTSTPEIVQYLVDHGARLISRLTDGRTALHLAAARGDVDIIRILLNKSEENEEEEAQKRLVLKKTNSNEIKRENDNDSDDADMLSNSSSESLGGDNTSYATGSFVNVKKGSEDSKDGVIPDDGNELEPNIYDVNVLAWDNHTSPLHLAIINGHIAAVEELVSSFGADVLLPIKLLNDHDQSPRAAILTLVLALRLPIEQAKLMTAKLLQLGASPAQADLSQNTALLYFSAFKEYIDGLDIFLQHDQPSVQRALDFISLTGYAGSVKSPLKTAIQQRNVVGALKLLEAGAKPEIRYEDYIKQAKITAPNVLNRSPESNQNNFSTNVEQPIIVAAQTQQPSVAIELLASGVDVNTLSTAGYSSLIYDHWNGNGTTLLDCVQERLTHLRRYKGETVERNPPISLHPEDSTYLKEFSEGTYQMWTGSRSLRAERAKDKATKEDFERQLKAAESRKGLQEKMDVVNDLADEYQTLETMLMEKGAKKFVELYPQKIKLPQIPTSYNHQPTKPQPFKVSFTFKTPDLTETKKDGYVQLFEAAWNGDLNTIKSMTLDMWGPEKQFFPLEICVTDRDDLSPFNIAILRGHIGLAGSIMSISKAQYKPKEEETEERFTLDTGSDYDSDSDSGGDDSSNEIRVRRHIIDDRFTIENVGEIKTQVESKVPPLNILNQTCPAHAFIEKEKLQGEHPQGVVEYAICKDDPKLLKFLLELGKQLSANSSHDTDHSIYSIPEKTFLMAMRLSRLDCLKELIRRVGTGIPLDKLVERSGVVAKEKPIYYQGLSVHGEKRADWAAESRGVVITQPQDRHPPLLLAAYQGNLETVEWFLGTAPGRHYEEFVQTNKHEKRVEKLAQTAGGVVHSITNWFTSRRDLVLHCAIMSNPTDESIRLVRYLVGQMPHCISVKSVQGYTPLALAFYLHRVEFAKILIQAGADQTTRDQHGRNLLHLLFFKTPESLKHVENFQQMLDLVDPLLVPSMLVERSSLHPGSVTPFSQWINSQWLRNFSSRYHHVNEEPKAKLAIVRKILDFAQGTGQKHLEALNGAGNSVVHDAVRFQVPKTLGLILEYRPDLIHLENATGATPKEIAETAWVHDVTKDPPSLDTNRYKYNYHSRPQCVVCRSPESFVEENLEAKDEKLPSQGVYEVCRDWACKERTSKKRKLVTLFDANEVAKRLAAQNTWKTNWDGGRGLQNATDKEMDEVLAWLNSTRVD
ncbi:uncharacterized protein TRUGW13939_11889 [Talaromyces rugulosus]|uniref:Ankyrin repeat protein n=1 Tax=Talaromyces rugulosus TaxID=121627 RepID=A0A7H8RJ92_TALRU|nr:uncharacterized protein TRUGW13939_11889 [Talaromyces rugulosus]QKX64713.1 hypothetical protein TRUGW13939_11889 [Talaromyces rugulosus]